MQRLLLKDGNIETLVPKLWKYHTEALGRCQTVVSPLHAQTYLQPEVENSLEHHLRTGRASTLSGIETSTKAQSLDAVS